MTAFDTAWDLVKMPIIPGSIRETDDGMEAQFHDPQTNKIYPMVSEYDMYGLNTRIMDNDGKPLAVNHISDHYSPEWKTSHAQTRSDYKRRGLMTAVYNLVNEMAKKKNARLTTFPSQLNEYSAPFWAKHMELPYEGDERRSAHTKFQDDYRGIRLRWPYDGVHE
jgi:hypothetical protein